MNRTELKQQIADLKSQEGRLNSVKDILEFFSVDSVDELEKHLQDTLDSLLADLTIEFILGRSLDGYRIIKQLILNAIIDDRTNIEKSIIKAVKDLLNPKE